MMSGFEISEIKRILGNLVRIGIIEEVSGNRYRVRLDGDLITEPLVYISRSNADLSIETSPQAGDPVVVISTGNVNDGFILGFVAREKDNAEQAKIEFKDGTKLSYDQDKKHLEVKTSGKVTVIADSVEFITSLSGAPLKDKENMVLTTGCIDPFTGAPFPDGDPKLTITRSL